MKQIITITIASESKDMFITIITKINLVIFDLLQVSAMKQQVESESL